MFLEGSGWMSSVSEDKVVNIHRNIETGSVTIFYYSKNGYDFSKSNNEIILLLTVGSAISSFCKLR